MEALETALFENPLGIYIALWIIAILGLVSYGVWRTLRAAWPTAAAIVAGLIVFTVSTLVVTDREQISAATDEIITALNNRDMLVVEHYLDDEFAGKRGYSTREKAIKWLSSNLKQHRISDIRHKILDLKVRDDLANMALRSDMKTGTVGLVRLNWRVIWIKRSDRWLVYKASGPLAGLDTEKKRE